MKTTITKQAIAAFLLSATFIANTFASDTLTNIGPDSTPADTTVQSDKTHYQYPPIDPYVFTFSWPWVRRMHPEEYNVHTKDFSNRNYADANFAGMTLTNANFKNSVLSQAVFKAAHLNGVNFQGATLMGCDFTRADLSGADLSGAVLSDTKLIHANLKNATYNKYTQLPDGFVPEKYGMIFLP